MLTKFIIIIAVSIIAAAIIAVLLMKRRLFTHFGLCKITINKNTVLNVKSGRSLKSSLATEKIFIPSACGGRGICGLCKCKVISGGGAITPAESPFLSAEDIKQGIRLSCQIILKQNISIELPAELLKIREFKAVCAKITDLTYDIKAFRFELINKNTINFTPGQYVQLVCPKYQGNPDKVYRAYSISSDKKQNGIIELIIRKVPGGISTTYCFEHLKKGDNVIFTGPYGDFKLSDTNKPMIFIAGGSGMSPMKCLLHELVNTKSNRQCTYFFGGNTVKDHFYADMMADFQKKLPNFKFVPVVANKDTNDGWTGKRGLVTEVVKMTYTDLTGYEAYLCGSPGMIDASIKVLTEMGMPENAIFFDKFA